MSLEELKKEAAAEDVKQGFFDRVKSVLKESTMNRINLLIVLSSVLMSVDSIVSLSDLGVEFFPLEIPTDLTDEEDRRFILKFSQQLFAMMGFLFAQSNCLSCGRTTVDSYHRTLEHIDKKGMLSSNFFKAQMKLDYDSWVVGYCQVQGMYFAAKERGFLTDFKLLKEEETKNIVPNF